MDCGITARRGGFQGLLDCPKIGGKHGRGDKIALMPEETTSTEESPSIRALMEAIRRQYEQRGNPEFDAPILRVEGLRTILKLRFDRRMGNAMAQGELGDVDETTLWFFKDLVDRAVEEMGLTDTELYGIYKLINPDAPESPAEPRRGVT